MDFCLFLYFIFYLFIYLLFFCESKSKLRVFHTHVGPISESLRMQVITSIPNMATNYFRTLS